MALVSPKRSKEAILVQIAEAAEKSAEDETPANPTFENFPPEGNFVKPTLLTGSDVIPAGRVLAVVTLSRFGFEQFVKLKSYHINDCPR